MPRSPAQVLAPHEAALRIADALYAGENEPTPDSRTFDLAGFQEDAVRRARKILHARRGVLIADSVGLGKTYIALALIEEELGRGGRILVATPAALRKMWRMPLRRIARAHGIAAVTGLGRGRGAGSPQRDDAAARGAPPSIALAWTSHARLSRGVGDPADSHSSRNSYSSSTIGYAATGPTLIVVDEAHAFRNPRTRRYRELARLSLNARVVLLTATPVNNTLVDLYSLIRLFAADTQFRDLGVEDLRALFRAAARQPDTQPAPALLGVLRAIMIRRTRPLLRETHRLSRRRSEADRRADAADASNLRFPERAPPRVLHYDLEAAVPNLLDDVAGCFDALTFAPFRVPAYGPRRATMHASGAAELIRMMMLKRLESSVAALASSIDAQIAFVESFVEHLESGRLLRPADHRATRNASDAAQLLLGGVALDPLPRRIDAHSLRTDAAADLERLRVLRRRLPHDPPTQDAKLARLRALIDRDLADERVLVFTEFRETARYLWTTLRDRGGIALIHGGGAFLGRSRCGRREVVERFAPAANGAATPPSHEAVRVLIATDVMSEGMNLQDARHVVSYDLPWNPVRLIQRIGRIDRLGSTHDIVFAHTFIPQRGLDRLIGLLERVRVKLAAIHTGVGAETCLPRELAAPALLDRLARGDPAVLDEIERHDAAPFEAEERLRLAYLRTQPRTAEPPATATPVVAVQRTASNPVSPRPTPSHARAGCIGTPPLALRPILLAVRTGGTIRLAVRTGSGQLLLDSPSAFEALTTLIEGTGNSIPSPSAPPIEPDYEAIAHALQTLRRLLDTPSDGHGHSRDPTHHRRTTPGHALSRRLLDALARVPGGPDTQLCARAEKLLAMLARGGPAWLDHALASLRATTGLSEGAAALCDTLETLWSGSDGGYDPAATGGPWPSGRIELIGAIELASHG